MTKPISIAAQTILKAAYEATRNPNWQTNFYTSYAAAALRAAADQVVPEPSDIDKGSFSLAAIRNRCKVRDEILAIAAELEGGND
jgi:hypothetical protein